MKTFKLILAALGLAAMAFAPQLVAAQSYPYDYSSYNPYYYGSNYNNYNYPYNYHYSVPNLLVSCTPDTTRVQVGMPVTWRASVSGGTGQYTYAWHSNGQHINWSVGQLSVVFNQTGKQYVDFNVTSGNQSRHVSCGYVNVENSYYYNNSSYSNYYDYSNYPYNYYGNNDYLYPYTYQNNGNCYTSCTPNYNYLYGTQYPNQFPYQQWYNY